MAKAEFAYLVETNKTAHDRPSHLDIQYLLIFELSTLCNFEYFFLILKDIILSFAFLALEWLNYT